MNELKITDVKVNPGDAAFLIDDGQTSILYDTGFGFTGHEMAEKIKKVLGERELNYIFLTHSHYDHALGVPHILRQYKEAKVVAGEYATHIFSKPTARAAMRDLDRKFADICKVGEYEDLTDELRVDIVVSDGDVIKAGDMEFTVLNLPGHTRCSIGFYCPQRKLLLACESLGVYDGEGDIMPIYLVGFKMAISSIERVQKLDIENIVVPHYGLLEGEEAKLYLKKGKETSEYIAMEIVQMLKNGKSRQEAVEFYKDKFYHGYIKSIYPIDAMKLNTSLTVDLIAREFGI